MSNMGIKSGNTIAFNQTSSSFEKVYPQNNVKLGDTNSAVRFMWDNAFGANKYRLIVARDSSFANVVCDKTVDYNITSVDNLVSDGSTYYWKVFALNTSKEFFSTWENTDGIYSFTLGNQVSLTYLKLKNSSNNEVASIANIYDGVLKVSASVLNKKYQEGKTGDIIIAIYDDNERLFKVAVIDTSLQYNIECAKESIFTLPTDGSLNNNWRIRIMVWDKKYSPLISTY
jgi:hypothetical protein